MEMFLPINYKLCCDYEIVQHICNTEFSNIYVVKCKGKKYILKEYFPKNLVLRDENGKVFTKKNRDEYEKYRAIFKTEIKNLKKLNIEKGIVKIIDNFKYNNTEYIVMEKIEGSSLKEIIMSKNKMKLQEIIDIFLKIIKIVSKIHKNKILHLDINPKNIILDKNMNVKIIDFGASKKLDNKIRNEVVVCDGYSALEQYSFTAIKDERSDIYSIFSVLYFMLLKRKLKSSYERFLNDIEFEKSKVGITKKYGKKLGKLVKKGLEIEKEKRYSNLEKVLVEVKGIK